MQPIFESRHKEYLSCWHGRTRLRNLPTLEIRKRIDSSRLCSKVACHPNMESVCWERFRSLVNQTEPLCLHTGWRPVMQTRTDQAKTANIAFIVQRPAQPQAHTICFSMRQKSKRPAHGVVGKFQDTTSTHWSFCPVTPHPWTASAVVLSGGASIWAHPRLCCFSCGDPFGHVHILVRSGLCFLQRATTTPHGREEDASGSICSFLK